MNMYLIYVEEWAYAYKHGAEINTNIYVETFHCLLKVVYLDSKQNHCVDEDLAINREDQDLYEHLVFRARKYAPCRSFIT